MAVRCFAVAMLLTMSSLACATTFTLDAKAGEFNAKTFGVPSSEASFSAGILLKGFEGAPGWPPAAYVGFFQGKNRNDSFQFLVIRNKPEDSYVVAGYRVVQGGKEVQVSAIDNLPLGKIASVELRFNNGVVTLVVPGQKPITVQTHLKKVSSYASVSSSTVEFEIAP
jgi:hypothetical protein